MKQTSGSSWNGPARPKRTRHEGPRGWPDADWPHWEDLATVAANVHDHATGEEDSIADALDRRLPRLIRLFPRHRDFRPSRGFRSGVHCGDRPLVAPRYRPEADAEKSRMTLGGHDQ
ncbi:hypothetical protein Ahu01nite_005930 [Winogradskya humida]|uniref:Uncharacterized protein n=1 Tax=Winogradskya humida TaxID=113566 RepID=A0ABQ3ZFY3_9ACTN|nr:hypothetical protein Ahu01nite_005930 [Actinoplanes humidus]